MKSPAFALNRLSVRRVMVVSFLLVAVGSALLPWGRNRHYINDFYDYGVTITAVGRIASGERPYVDFVSPLQTGGFLLNAISERVFGATFQGMTWGCAVLIMVATGVFFAVLSRRLSSWAAITLSAALVWCTIIQHTIIWYNGVGVVCLALVAWICALTPVMRRAGSLGYALVGVALFLGGINKASFQMIALAVALAWAVRAGLTKEANWGRVLVTACFILVCGGMLPIGFEVVWTGAGFKTWWYNVVALPGGGRSGDLMAILNPEFFLRHHHNYYGRLPIPWVGLLGVLMTAWVAAGGLILLPKGRYLDRFLLLAACALAAGAGVGLLATNKEIAYISFAGWSALLVGVWFGFGLPVRGWAFNTGLLAPTVVLGVFGWQAAWTGQRAHWGYSPHPKSDYIAGDSAGSDFGYLRGTRIPPEWVASLQGLVEMRDQLAEQERSELFYGSGTEWLERVWPTTKVPGIPLWLDYGTSYSSVEMKRLSEAIGPGGAFRRVTLTVQRDVWFGESRPVVERNYVKKSVGPALVVYERGDSDGVSVHPLDFLGKHGGNVDSNVLKSSLDWHALDDGRFFLGSPEGTGEMTLSVPLRRFRGEVVLKRLKGNDGSLFADFLVTALAADQPPYDRWRRRVDLPAGEDEVVLAYEGDVNALPLKFTVTLPEEAVGRMIAGWRNLSILHSIETSEEPPNLSPKPWGQQRLDEAAMAALFGDQRRPVSAYTRGGRLVENGFLLPPGGELWIRADEVLNSIAGYATVVPGQEGRADTVIRAFSYKGGRLSITTQEGPREDRIGFRAWSAEPGGWLALWVDDNFRSASIMIHLDPLPPE